MTTDKPKVVAYARTGALDRILPLPWKLPIVSDWSPMYSDPLIRLSDYEKLQAECEKLRKGLAAVQELIDDSYGVAGLHLNGDIAPWSDLREGGRFEEWLAEFDAALAQHQGA